MIQQKWSYNGPSYRLAGTQLRAFLEGDAQRPRYERHRPHLQAAGAVGGVGGGTRHPPKSKHSIPGHVMESALSQFLTINFITGLMTFRNARRLLFGVVAAATVYDCLTPEKILIRNLNTLRCGFWILWNYKVKFDANNFMEIHEATAKDIYESKRLGYAACLYNDGLYVKFGQGMAASDHVLPPPFFKWMSKLQDKAKSCTYEVVSKVFE